MERQIPKNVRQIGNVSDSPKIYVEDYVDTFFAQLSDKYRNCLLYTSDAAATSRV